MTLTKTQTTLLTAAAKDKAGAVTLPKTLKGGAANKVVDALLNRGLIERHAEGSEPGLRITADGRTAVGTKPAAKAGSKPAANNATTNTGDRPHTRQGTKQALVIDMLKRKSGATINEMAEATGWQSHTVRGALAGALKKRLGLEIVSEKVEGRGRVYRIA